MEILFEDKYITVCIKQPGVLSEESGNHRSMPLLLKEHYRENAERDDLYTLHRLDKNVGGIMIFARNPKSASILAGDIAGRRVEKCYHAVVMGRPDPEKGVMNDILFHDSTKNKTFVVDRARRGSREACLEYELIKSVQQDNRLYSLVKIKLLTGRTHQIRAQFASRKMPLVGDGRYGSGDGKDSPALFSSSLSFVHPKTGKKMTFEHPLPSVYPFTLFEKTLLERAKTRLEEGGYTCVMLSEGDEMTFTKRGVAPLLELYERGGDYSLYTAADKVVGRAAAILYILLGVKQLYASVISLPALEILRQYGTSVTYGELVDAIRNRTNTGFCPMEQAVKDLENINDAPAVLKSTLDMLR